MDKRTLRRNPYYDSTEFKLRWHSRETLENIALDLGVTPRAVEKAAKRRGFTAKTEARKGETHNSPARQTDQPRPVPAHRAGI